MPWPGAPLHHQQQQPPPCPALFLYPLNDSFIPKQIALPHGQGRVKIGRQTNAKTVPGERNGYFDSKVLSRQHAEVWEENGKVYRMTLEPLLLLAVLMRQLSDIDIHQGCQVK